MYEDCTYCTPICSKKYTKKTLIYKGNGREYTENTGISQEKKIFCMECYSKFFFLIFWQVLVCAGESKPIQWERGGKWGREGCEHGGEQVEDKTGGRDGGLFLEG